MATTVRDASHRTSDSNSAIATAATDAAVNLEEIDFDELDDYLELFQQDGVIKEALSKGVDLQQYAQQIDHELRAAEIDSVSQYVLKADDIVALHDEVQACDDILATMQEMLLGFQADLGGISDEIRLLQDESIGMNVRLKNRRATEDALASFLDHVTLAPSLIATLDDGDVNDAFVSALATLHRKLTYATLQTPAADGSSCDLVPAQTAAFKDVVAQLEKLRGRATNRIREFLCTKISDIRKPKTNVQLVQQHSLLPLKYLVTFLASHARDVDDEIRDMYADAMSKTLVHVFRSYHAGLLKLHDEVATRTDVLAIEEQSLRGLFSSKVNLAKRNDTFSIGDRDKLLTALTAPPLGVHVAQQESLKLPYEAIFRHVQQHLLNAATTEFLFLVDFFGDTCDADSNSGPQPQQRTRDLFLRVFAKTLSLCLEHLENYLCTSYDAIALLLMLRVTYAQRVVMQRRRVSVLDTYLDRVTLLLWPRFKAVFDLNVLSVKQAKVKKLGAVDLHPHYVIRRYAEFAASVLSLSSMYTQSSTTSPSVDNGDSDDAAIASTQMHENGAGDMVLHNLAVLRDEIVALLARLADQHKTSKDRCVFLINNYDFVLSVFLDRRIVSDETSQFDELLAAQRERFVEEELFASYAKLIQFVRDNERVALGSTSTSSTTSIQGTTDLSNTVDLAQIETIVREFARTWKRGIETMNAHVMTYFSNFRNGMEILKQVLTQLLLYYTRFIEIVKRSYSGGRQPSFGPDIVTTQEMLYEIKKYSRSF